MGEFLNSIEKTKITGLLVLSIIVGFHYFYEYASRNTDMTAFAIFAFACFSAYLTLKSAKEIIACVEDKKYKRYMSLEQHWINNRRVSPVGFKTNSGFSKYATSVCSPSLKLVS